MLLTIQGKGVEAELNCIPFGPSEFKLPQLVYTCLLFLIYAIFFIHAIFFILLVSDFVFYDFLISLQLCRVFELLQSQYQAVYYFKMQHSSIFSFDRYIDLQPN